MWDVDSLGFLGNLLSMQSGSSFFFLPRDERFSTVNIKPAA